MKLRWQPVVSGCGFGILLGIAGHGLGDWRFWLLMVGFAVLSLIERLME